ncbi:MAG: hypothetical protein J5819_05830 [Eubacterium sp.]|nr:hypothetical protein [Eubacterium sp.]
MLRKRKWLAIMLVMILMLTACGENKVEETVQTAEPKEEETTKQADSTGTDGSWAVYWYLCGSDLESEHGFATTDLDELTEVTLPDNVTVIIQAGGASAWQNDMISADQITRLKYQGNSLEVIDELDQANMGDSETLADFLSFCNKDYPADHKMVVFWDHGGGSTSGASYDENYDGDYLTIPELRQAFEATCEPSESEQPYDIIGFDTCLMATIDVAGMCKDIGKYLVASEETEPGLGWCYNGWVGKLAEDTSISPADLGKAICDTYYSACEENGMADEITLSVTDLSKVSAVQEAYSAVGDELLEKLCEDNSYISEYDRCARSAQNYGGNTDKSGYSDMADLGDLVNLSSEIMPNSSDPLESALSDAVVYQVMGNYRKKASGLSCYYPYSYNRKLYKGYHKATETVPFDYYYEYMLSDDTSPNEEMSEYLNNLLGVEETPEKQEVNEDDFENHVLKIRDGNTAVMKLGPDKAALLNSVNFEMAIYDDEIFMYMGTRDCINADWENGVFADEFDGTWGAIDDHVVYMEVSDHNDEYTIYSVPIKLNGEECFLDCAIDNETGEGQILGAKSGIEEDGVSAKDYRTLAVGDEITTLMLGGYIDGGADDSAFVDMDTFTVTEDTSFGMTFLGDGNYAMTMEMLAIDGQRFTSDLMTFVVDGDHMTYD